VLTPIDEVEDDQGLQRGEDGKEGISKGEIPLMTGIDHAAGKKGEEEEQGGKEKEGEAGSPTEGGKEGEITRGSRVLGKGGLWGVGARRGGWVGSNTVQSFCYVPPSDPPLLLPCLFPRFSFRPPPPPSLPFLALTRTSPVTNSFTG